MILLVYLDLQDEFGTHQTAPWQYCIMNNIKSTVNHRQLKQKGKTSQQFYPTNSQNATIDRRNNIYF